MLLPFTDANSLVETWRCDPEMALLADGHYSRQSSGHREFMGNGSTLVIRNAAGTVLFGWIYQIKRDDRQQGINCSIFVNLSSRKSSDIILEAEYLAIAKWGARRLFTYVDSNKINSANPGYCFKCAGWRNQRDAQGFPARSKSGKLILEKLPS